MVLINHKTEYLISIADLEGFLKIPKGSSIEIESLDYDNKHEPCLKIIEKDVRKSNSTFV